MDPPRQRDDSGHAAGCRSADWRGAKTAPSRTQQPPQKSNGHICRVLGWLRVLASAKRRRKRTCALIRCASDHGAYTGALRRTVPVTYNHTSTFAVGWDKKYYLNHNSLLSFRYSFLTLCTSCALICMQFQDEKH